MKWLFLAAGVWYWWLLYTLTFNPDQFPDPKYAHKVWDHRFTLAYCLGAGIATASLYRYGTIDRWWVVALSLVISALVAALLQPLLVGLIVYSKLARIIVRTKLGLEPGKPMLAPFAWTPYLTAEEREIHQTSSSGK